MNLKREFFCRCIEVSGNKSFGYRCNKEARVHPTRFHGAQKKFNSGEFDIKELGNVLDQWMTGIQIMLRRISDDL